VGLYGTATKHWRMTLPVLSVAILCSLLAQGQEVQVTPGKNSVSLTITAVKSYHFLATEEKQPTLTLECSQKGNKAGHLLLFSAGLEIAEDNPETAPRSGALTLTVKIAGTKQPTTWVAYGNTETFAYYGKTEPERLKFIQSVLSSPTISIQFSPFLTGQVVTSEFDLGQLRNEVAKHPECGLK